MERLRSSRIMRRVRNRARKLNNRRSGQRPARSLRKQKPQRVSPRADRKALIERIARRRRLLLLRRVTGRRPMGRRRDTGRLRRLEDDHKG
jgi:hypothetical protein